MSDAIARFAARLASALGLCEFSFPVAVRRCEMLVALSRRRTHGWTALRFDSWTTRFRVTVSALAVAATLIGCKPKEPACSPKDVVQTIDIVAQAAERINLGADGGALPTTLRIYQLKNATTIDGLDFQSVWEDGKAALGDAYVSEEELTVFPARTESRHIEPKEDTTHVLAVALFREPIGRSWLQAYELPLDYKQAVCTARTQQERELGTPCFHLYIEQNRLDGGHGPPPGFDATKVTIACAPPPSQYPQPVVEEKKKKRKKGKKPKLDPSKPPEAPKAPEAKPPEAPKAPQAPKAPGAAQTFDRS